MKIQEPKAKYEQVADDLRRSIFNGTYTRELPSQPELGRRYGLSQTSVKRAFDILVSEGLITVERGRQARVITRPGMSPEEALRPRRAKAMFQMWARRTVVSTCRDWDGLSNDERDLWCDMIALYGEPTKTNEEI